MWHSCISWTVFEWRWAADTRSSRVYQLEGAYVRPKCPWNLNCGSQKNPELVSYSVCCLRQMFGGGPRGMVRCWDPCRMRWKPWWLLSCVLPLVALSSHTPVPQSHTPLPWLITLISVYSRCMSALQSCHPPIVFHCNARADAPWRCALRGLLRVWQALQPTQVVAYLAT